MDQLDTVNTTTIGEDNEEAAARAARAALAAATRIVVKIGTATITKPKDAPARLTRSHKPSGNATRAGAEWTAPTYTRWRNSFPSWWPRANS